MQIEIIDSPVVHPVINYRLQLFFGLAHKHKLYETSSFEHPYKLSEEYLLAIDLSPFRDFLKLLFPSLIRIS